MKNKKLIITILGITILIALGWLLKKHIAPSTTGPIIGILQTASHPALDAAREGFAKKIGDLMGSEVTIVTYNAEGSIANAYTLAQRLAHNPQLVGLYTIATPATQAAASVEKEKSIVFAAVTNPESIMTADQKNVSGVTDMINMHNEIEMLHSLLPEVKTVALVYSSGEENSIHQVAIIKKELKSIGLESIDVGISQESDIPAALSIACRKADALMCPTDNMIACAMELVASTALAHKKPLIACHNQAVYQGALAARGVDYLECGEQAAVLMHSLLDNTNKNAQSSIEQATSDTIYINKKTLDSLGLTIPKSLQDKIKLIE